METKKEKKGYKNTLNLPKTGFSMKANLSQKEPAILKEWEKTDIYARIMEKRKNAGRTFILHDGPPYANGHIHMGHVLNKILKDICVKYFTMKGYRSPYVPGWDCHGLPVEHQLFKELKMTKHQIDQVGFRKKAHDYAMKFVKIQSEEFKRIGVFGDWKKPYLTLTKGYEADILLVLADLYDKGYIYKDLKPVNWCSRCETALAEAEVEYEDKTSPSIYVKFRTDGGQDGKTFFVIWTTTPWTLLANVAVCLHPDFEYAFVETGDETWIMAASLVAPLMEKFDIEEYTVRVTMKGTLVAEKFPESEHPLVERTSRTVLAGYVTREEGTGCVHTAPGHGQEDHVTGKRYNLPVIMPVDNAGKFTAETGKYSGQPVIKSNGAIINDLRAKGALIGSGEIKHSYPHCWRCKEPIIFRATEQWFLKVDHEGLREKILRTVQDDVEWIPRDSKERIGSMVRQRPDWCLSRQRYWGVPIPALKCKECGKTFTGGELIRFVSALTREFGADVWFMKPVSELITDSIRCTECGGLSFEKENDILDVWFDSGVSHKAVLESRDDLSFPADLYLEGSDQHRGWFQAAAITAVAVKDKAPYRKVLTHGFVVDGQGKKMSKSIGNVIHPEKVMKKYGADILRLWVASSDYMDDIKLSEEILERLADGYRKIRNTFRFLLSNLYDFDLSANGVSTGQMNELNRWMLARLYVLAESVDGHYSEWEFHKVYRSIYDFCVYEVSAFYLDIVKDVLYVDAPDSPERRAVQTVVNAILTVLVRLLAPVLSFTCEEVWREIPGRVDEESVHMADWPDISGVMSEWKDQNLIDKWDRILDIRDGVMKVLEIKRGEGIIGSSLEAAISLYSDNHECRAFFSENIGLFPAIFKVSGAYIMDKDEEGSQPVDRSDFRIKVVKAKGQKCQRCWNYSDSVGFIKEHPDLCSRCGHIVSERSTDG